MYLGLRLKLGKHKHEQNELVSSLNFNSDFLRFWLGVLLVYKNLVQLNILRCGGVDQFQGEGT